MVFCPRHIFLCELLCGVLFSAFFPVCRAARYITICKRFIGNNEDWQRKYPQIHAIQDAVSAVFSNYLKRSSECTLYLTFQGHWIWCCHWSLPQTDPCCHGNQNLGILVPNLLQLGLHKRYSRESCTISSFNASISKTGPNTAFSMMPHSLGPV